MKKRNVLCVLLATAFAVFIMAGSAMALTLTGNEITIFDGMGVPGEDNEVEPNCVNKQYWDLEGFFLDGTTLAMVGGYDFENGQSNGNTTFLPGDVFIDDDFDAQYGSKNTMGGDQSNDILVQNTFGYDYAIKLDFDNEQYTVYTLDSDTTTTRVWYDQNEESNPWQLSVGNEASTTSEIGDLVFGEIDVDGYFNGQKDGNTHYVVELRGLTEIVGTNFISHYTYGCGNDNLMGKSVPEPATILLIGTGLIGLAGFSRKKLVK